MPKTLVLEDRDKQVLRAFPSDYLAKNVQEEVH